ncbi:MAG: Mitochondrial intermediate peptidase [Trizodia sp. TS-e1964]|nr:MAG: Mitochondrial intermediate peptidase [Trizodia sp. TS-e1964]
MSPAPQMSSYRGPSAGLFQNKYLTSPSGFHKFASVTTSRAQRIVDKILAASTTAEYTSIARDLDRLSDLLCRVIDACDFVRSTHPDSAMQTAADSAFAEMFEYMNVLNTTTGLNTQLRAALARPEIVGAWSAEELHVARLLELDFLKSAIHLPAEERRRFVALSSEVSELGTRFVGRMAPEKEALSFDAEQLRGMDSGVVRRLTNWKRVLLPVNSLDAIQALRTVDDESTRMKIFTAGRTASTGQVNLLELLLRRRAELAKLSGYQSYSEMTTYDKMAKNPESISQFLQALSTDNSPGVSAELSTLLSLQQGSSDIVEPWNRDYLASLLPHPTPTSRISPFFSLGTVIQGLSSLFNRIYGIRFIPQATLPGEVWEPSVRRLDVYDESEGHIAVLYLDLFTRPGKTPNPAHFTLRCSRLISASELAELNTTPVAPGFSSAEEQANDGMATAYNSHNSQLYQLPTIVITCDFTPTSPFVPQPTLLSLNDVRTLFHEMGHAMHSIVGRTSFQNVSGTRCATDLAELPSLLTEHLATAPAALALYASHWKTGQPLPADLLAQHVAAEQQFAALETQRQIKLAQVDQAYHSAAAGAPDYDSTAVFHEIMNRGPGMKEPPTTRWQGLFGHLVGYGALYYAYLFDKAIAGRVWREVFGGGRDALSREAGEKVKSELLAWGGGRDGWACVAGVLGDERLKGGGVEAMAEVGRWGVRSK